MRLVRFGLMALLFLTSGMAEGKNYVPSSSEWDGMNSLRETAREARVRMEYLTELDWADVSISDILIFLYPEQSLDLTQARSFVEHGGHVVIADDHGASSTFLASVGIHRQDGFEGHDLFLYEDENFPILTPASQHFLFFNLREAGGSVVGNYPSAFRVDDGVQAILTYRDPEQVFIAEVQVGDGAVLAVADGSLFINEMQRHHGDKQLVANLFRYFCRSEPCKVRVVLPVAEHYGVFVPPPEKTPESLDSLFKQSVDMINAVVSSLRSSMTEGVGLRVFWVLLSLLLVVGTGVFFVMRTELRAVPWEGVHRVIPSMDAQRAAGVLGAWQHAEFAEPLRHLLSILESTIGGSGRVGFTTERQRKDLARRFAQRYGQTGSAGVRELEGSVMRVLRFAHTFNGGPSSGGTVKRAVNYKVFLEVVADARPILDAVDRRRTWSRFKTSTEQN